MSLFIDEVVEENAKLKEENKHLIEKYEILGEEWSKLLDDKISYSHLLQKYKKVIDILKKELHLKIIPGYVDTDDNETFGFTLIYREDLIFIKKEEYELLKEVLGDE